MRLSLLGFFVGISVLPLNLIQAQSPSTGDSVVRIHYLDLRPLIVSGIIAPFRIETRNPDTGEEFWYRNTRAELMIWAHVWKNLYLGGGMGTEQIRSNFLPPIARQYDVHLGLRYYFRNLLYDHEGPAPKKEDHVMEHIKYRIFPYLQAAYIRSNTFSANGIGFAPVQSDNFDYPYLRVMAGMTIPLDNNNRFALQWALAPVFNLTPGAPLYQAFTQKVALEVNIGKMR